jgi:predicted adenylyl cyclase CyaB
LIETEVRYQINEEQLKNIESAGQVWSAPSQLVDAVFASGVTSPKKADWFVRLRTASVGSRMEYKGRMNEEGNRWEEIGFGISDHKAAAALLMQIGLSPVIVIDRIRREAVFGKVKLAIDEVKYLGIFIEIEAEAISINEATDLLHDAATKLGVWSLPKSPPYGRMIEDVMEEDSNVRDLILGHLTKLISKA